MVGWLGKVFLQDGPARPTSPEAGPTLRRWRCHVQRFFYRIYAGLRIEELFSIIRGRPRLLPPSLYPGPAVLEGGEGCLGLLSGVELVPLPLLRGGLPQPST